MPFTFGAAKTDANTASGFTFGGNAGAGDAKTAAAKPFGFSIPQPSTTSFNLGGFSAAATPPATTAQSTGFTLGGSSNPGGLNISASTTPSFNLGGTTTNSNLSLGGVTAQPLPGFSFGATATPAMTAAATSTGIALGGTTTAMTPTPLSASGFGLLGTPKTQASTATPTTTTGPTTLFSGGFNLGGITAASTAPLTSTIPTTTAASATLLGLVSAAATKTTTAAVAPTFSLSAITAAKPATTGFSLTTPASPLVVSTTTAAPVATTSTTTATTTTSASVLPTVSNLNFGQLVDAITKWTIDLDEQGKLFSNQAKQLNAWDRLLVSNGEKVLALNSGIERVKQQQQQLDQELDFVHAQQKELEDLIAPLEKELADMPLTDVDRLHTYQLAENMDTQLKQMSEDLKEIIEQLNESNKAQENSNPITQIRKILNAHMDSLQWIDRHTSKITGHLDQISKMHDLHRKSHEHSLKKTYD